MSEEYVSKLQEDLRKKLDHLSWMHNEPALFVAEHFAELRNQVDLDAEELLSEIQSVKRDTGKASKVSDMNKTRLEFIRILEELEKRTGHQTKPQSPASEVYASFEQRIDAFKDFKKSLDDLDESYIQLAREILNEIDRVDRRLLGEQTIIYWPHQSRTQLGSLVYFGDLFLCRRDIERLSIKQQNEDIGSRSQIYDSSYLVPVRLSDEINTNQQVMESIFNADLGACFSEASKFFYVGKTENEYSGYLAESSSVDREFVSYQRKDSTNLLQIPISSCFDLSTNLFDNYSSKKCELQVQNHRLERLHVNLLPTPSTRLVKLVLEGVHFESFDTILLATCTNLTELIVQATFSKGVEFDLSFLGALIQLQKLKLTLPNSPKNLSAFSSLTRLYRLKLEGSLHFYAEKLPTLSHAVLKQILSAPNLLVLQLYGFEIEAIRREMFSECKHLCMIDLTKSRIGRTISGQITHLGFPHSFDPPNIFTHGRLSTVIRLVHNDIRTLNAANFAGMISLIELLLTGNLIANLPRGVFHNLPALERLELDKNRIKHIRKGIFGRLEMLERLSMDANPTESIEANAFCQLNELTELSLERCRLKSIDSEMFAGLSGLRKLILSNNLIERIEVVDEDGRRINVAKAFLSNEEKQMIKKHLFKDLSGLRELLLNGNKLVQLDLNCFSNLKSLFSLKLSSNMINELGGQAEPELLFNLEQLDLENNQLTAVDKKTFPHNIHNLNLSMNHLKQLDEDFFAEFTRLKTVNLANNELTWAITDATFTSCRGTVVEIDLSQNQSIKFTDGAFREMRNLRWIDCDLSRYNASLPPLRKLRISKSQTPEVMQVVQQLCINRPQSWLNKLEACCFSDCSIKSLTRNPDDSKSELKTPPETGHFTLKWLPNKSQLKELDFSNNLIETLDDPELFVDFGSIFEINLSNNLLNRIHRDIFIFSFFNLNKIDMSGNKLSSIDMGLFRSLINLKQLDLSFNSISLINLARLFRVIPSLTCLRISDNQLDERSTAEPIDARTCCHLEKLVLANNSLDKMDFVRDMTSLKELDLRGNRIETVMSNNGENLLGRLKQLTHLDLSKNEISRLTDEMFDHLSHQLERLNLYGNPLDFQLNSILLEII